MDFLSNLNPEVLIKTFGYLGLFVAVFAESGLFIGFFLPGDSLIFTAGILASQGLLSIWVLPPLLFIAAVLGDNFGYAFGRRLGPQLFSREDSRFFHRKHLERAQTFYARYGKATLIIARFTPIVRTFAPIVAGAGKMHYPTFFVYNIVGAFIWVMLNTLLGYFLGKTVPNIERYIIPILVIIIVLSFLPAVFQFMRERKATKTS